MCDELEDLPSKTSGPPIKFSCSSLVKSWPKLGPVLPIEATAGITGAVVMLANVAGPVVHTAGKQHYVSSPHSCRGAGKCNSAADSLIARSVKVAH